MAFYPIYYITLACPTIEESRKKISEYIGHGALALQLDMPSGNPVYETPFIQAQMKRALETYDGYKIYMNIFRDIRKAYPSLKLHLVAYPDVVDSIGRGAFIDFCKSIKLDSFMPVSQDIEYRAGFKNDGLAVIESIKPSLDDQDIHHAALLRQDEIVTFRYRGHCEYNRPGLDTLARKILYLRERGVKAQIYAVDGIATEEMMREVKDAGMDGALVGNVLMRLWNSEKQLWTLFSQFQSLAEL